MKPTILVPPAVSLILVWAWVVPQRRSMAVLETECARLQSTITAAEAPSATRPDPLERRRKIIDWTKLGTQFQSNPMSGSASLNIGTMPDPREAMRFRQRMGAMSTGETRNSPAAIAQLVALPLRKFPSPRYLKSPRKYSGSTLPAANTTKPLAL